MFQKKKYTEIYQNFLKVLYNDEKFFSNNYIKVWGFKQDRKKLKDIYKPSWLKTKTHIMDLHVYTCNL